MKRASLFLCALVLLVLYGCGGSPAAPTATPIPVQPTAVPTKASAATTPTTAPAGAATRTTAPAGAATPPTATAGAPTATTATGGGPANTAAPVAGATTTALVVDVPTAAPPTSTTLTLTPPALPAAGTFSGTPGASESAALAVSVPVSITTKLATAGEEQWYKLDLSKYKGGTVVLDFTAAKAADNDQSIRLDNAAGDELARKDVAAGASQHIEASVKAEVVTLGIFGGIDAADPYQVGINFYPNSDHLDRASAVPLGVAGTVTGWINSDTDTQWYAVDMAKYPQGGSLTANLAVPAEAQGQYQLLLMDSSGANQLDRKDVSQGTSDSLTVEPAVATNYLLVVQSTGGTYDPVHPYTLTVTFTPHSAYSGPTTALAVTPPVLLRLTMPAAADVAYFSFKTTGATNVTATVSVPADGNPTRADIYEATGQNNFGSSIDVQPGSQGTATATLNNAGTYLLVVTRRGGQAVSTNPTTVELRVDAAAP